MRRLIVRNDHSDLHFSILEGGEFRSTCSNLLTLLAFADEITQVGDTLELSSTVLEVLRNEIENLKAGS